MNQRQALFVAEYIRLNFNATQAAIAAGYSERSAREIGRKLLTKVDIAAAVQAAIAERMMGPDEVKIRLADQARASIVDFLDMTEGPASVPVGLNITALRERGHLVKKITVNTRSGVIGIEMHDQQHALELIGKHLDIFVDHHHSGEVALVWDGHRPPTNPQP